MPAKHSSFIKWLKECVILRRQRIAGQKSHLPLASALMVLRWHCQFAANIFCAIRERTRSGKPKFNNLGSGKDRKGHLETESTKRVRCEERAYPAFLSYRKDSCFVAFHGGGPKFPVSAFRTLTTRRNASNQSAVFSPWMLRNSLKWRRFYCLLVS